jgi:hypothetical protein
MPRIQKRGKPCGKILTHSPCSWFLTVELREAYFQEHICPAEGRREPRQQVLPVDGPPRVRMFFRRQNARQRRDLGSSQFSTNCAGSNRHLRIVAHALRLAHFAERHDVKLVALFSKPYRRWNLYAALAKRAERDVFLAADLGRDWFGHGDIVNGSIRSRLSRLVRPQASQIDTARALC